jgi:hypothetical protein
MPKEQGSCTLFTFQFTHHVEIIMKKNPYPSRTQTIDYKEVLLVLIAALVLIVIREPKFLMEPRLWGEEGTIYIQHFLDSGWLSGFFAPHLGYYSFFANFSAVLGVSLLGLHWAAYFTTGTSLVVYLACIVSPLLLKSQYWENRLTRVALVGIAIIVSSPEIWLNSINSHFYLGLFACYLLLSDLEALSKKSLYGAVVLAVMAVLTSGTSVILAPLFALKYILSKRDAKSPLSVNRNFIFALIFVLGFVVQLLAKLLSVDDGVPRLSVEYFQYLPRGLMRTFFYLFSENPTVISTVFSAATTVAALVSFTLVREHRPALLLAIYVGLAYTLLSLGMMGGGRYSFIPSVILIVYGINVVQSLEARYLRYIFLALGIIFLLYRVQFYFDIERFYPDEWLSFSEEYSQAVEAGSDTVKVFPQWEGIDWRIDIGEK